MKKYIVSRKYTFSRHFLIKTTPKVAESSTTASLVVAVADSNLSNLMNVDNTKNEEKVETLIIQDIAKLEPYYKAISEIRKTLDQICLKIGYTRTGFEACPIPNPFYCRTPKYMYLETAIFKKAKKEEIMDLYTPFGKIQLLSGGLQSELLQISKIFLETMNWKLVDVTKKIQTYNYIQEDNQKFGPYRLKKETWEGAGTLTRVYLITKVGDIELVPKKYAITKNFSFFSSLVLQKGQYEQDQMQFAQLSHDTNMF